MNHLTIGVLGHVDHGKTALVKALTGVDTDRLKEEKDRGISIVLGFADLALPSGHAAFVDVPGHERFVRTMVSGATGIGAVLLAVSAVEGVMPQTVEHLEIAGLLGLRRGVVALTQCDRVSEEERAEASAVLRNYLAGTFLKDAPIVETSAVSGEGFDVLRAQLDALVRGAVLPEDEGHACLPVDRVFTMAGAGVVVTGTLRRGSIAEGEELEIYPRGLRATVRQVQSHGDRVARAMPGHRVAVNLRGIDREAIARGDALAHPGSLRVGRFADVELQVLASAGRALRDRERVRVLFGTTEAMGELRTLDHEPMAPGESGYARLYLDEPAAVLVREQFIVRSESPVRTLGGGRLLAMSEHRSRQHAEDARAEMTILASGDVASVLRLRCLQAEPGPLDLEAFAVADRFTLEQVGKAARALGLVPIDGGVVRSEFMDAIEKLLVETVTRLREADPLTAQFSLEAIQTSIANNLNSSVLEAAAESLVARGELTRDDGKLGLPGDDPFAGVSEAERALFESIAAAFRGFGLEPPALDDVIQRNDARFRAYKQLVASGVLITLHAANKPRTFDTALVFHRDNVNAARESLSARFGEGGRFETADAKSVLGISRKYLIPLLEHLDAEGFTRRAGEARVLAPRAL